MHKYDCYYLITVEIYQKELALIKNILRTHPRGMTVSDISRKIKINRNSVGKYLDILLVSGQVEMVSFGPAKVFFPSRRIPISTILNFTSDLIMLIDQDLNILQINDKFIKNFDINIENIIGKNINSLNINFLKNLKVLSKLEQALNGKETSINIKFENNNEINNFIIKNIPTIFDNGKQGVTLIIKDITEQKKVKKKNQKDIEWKNILNSIAEMISIQDQNHNIIKINRAFSDFFKVKHKKIIGKKCYEVIHGQKTKYSNCPYNKTTNSKSCSIINYYHPNSKKNLEIFIYPIKDKDDKFAGSIHIIKKNLIN
jgi:PAS domain S-box-containing protein